MDMTPSPTRARTPIDGLVVSGLTQIAVGALTGFPYAIATYKPELLGRLRVRAPGRVRQLHLDLIMMGGLVTATGMALPAATAHRDDPAGRGLLDQRAGLRTTGDQAVHRELARLPCTGHGIVRDDHRQLGRRRRDRPASMGRTAVTGNEQRASTWAVGPRGS